MNLLANQTTDNSWCVLLLDALHAIVPACSPPCPRSRDGFGGSSSMLSARDTLAKPAQEQELCSAFGTVTSAWQIGHTEVEGRETKVDLRNIFSRDHFFLFFRCKQLHCLENLVVILVPTAAKTISGDSRATSPSGVQASQRWCQAKASQELSSKLSSKNGGRTPSSSASCRGKGCCLLRERGCSQKDLFMTTVMLDTHFLGATLGRAFYYFWVEKVGHFKPKASHTPCPRLQQQPPCSGRGALEGISELLQIVPPQNPVELRHKHSTRHGPGL